MPRGRGIGRSGSAGCDRTSNASVSVRVSTKRLVVRRISDCNRDTGHSVTVTLDPVLDPRNGLSMKRTSSPKLMRPVKAIRRLVLTVPLNEYRDLRKSMPRKRSMSRLYVAPALM